jgi:hypothetical protein
MKKKARLPVILQYLGQLPLLFEDGKKQEKVASGNTSRQGKKAFLIV